jgi:hypothetical protein
MAENAISKVVADGRVFVKLVDMVVRLSKLRLQIHRRQQEKDRLIRHIGLTTFELCSEERTFDGEQIYDAVSRELASAQRIEDEITQLQEQIAQVKSNFRAASGERSPAAEK